jgi:outer membrane protein TolC
VTIAGLAACLVLALAPASSRAQAELGQPVAAQPQPVVVRQLTLEECIQIGLSRQPALAAAHASLAAAEQQRRALYNLKLAGLVSHELPYRRHQSDLGVTIAEAGVAQAEWETIYAVTRTYFSVLYAQKQAALLKGSIEKLQVTMEAAADKLKGGDVKVRQDDIQKLQLYISLYESRRIQAAQGAERALAALREAMGLDCGYPLDIVRIDFPSPNGDLCKGDLIALALSRRAELVQATTAAEVTDVEVSAQNTSHNLEMKTFAAAADIHAKPVPQGLSNGEYRPGAIGIEMPTMLAGRRPDRVQRARELSARAQEVVAKTRNLIVLETEDGYVRWKEATLKVKNYNQVRDKVTASLLEVIYQRYNLNSLGVDDLLKNQGLVDQVQAEANEALYQYALALAALERITAGGFVPPYRAAVHWQASK